MNENPEQNETPEFTLPEMQAGKNGMYSISAMDGIKMGPIVIQAFMQKLREAAEKADLEVKVEPMRGQLLIWWYPRTEPTFLEDLAQHISVVPAGEMDVVLGMIELDLEELLEGLKKLSGDLHVGINVKPDVLSEVPSVHLTWGPLPGIMSVSEFDASMDRTNEKAFYESVEGAWDLDSNTPIEEFVIYWEVLAEWVDKMFSVYNEGALAIPRAEILPPTEGYEQLEELFQKACSKHAMRGAMTLQDNDDAIINFSWRHLTHEDIKERHTRTYLDAVMEHVDDHERGKTTVSKKHMLSEQIQSMEQLVAFLEHLGERTQKVFALIHQPSSDEMVLHWRPFGEKELAWPTLVD